MNGSRRSNDLNCFRSCRRDAVEEPGRRRRREAWGSRGPKTRARGTFYLNGEDGVFDISSRAEDRFEELRQRVFRVHELMKENRVWPEDAANYGVRIGVLRPRRRAAASMVY